MTHPTTPRSNASPNTRDFLPEAREELVDLHEAIEGGQDKLVAALLEHGADVNAEDVKGRTPLGIAAQKDNQGITQLLLQKGADLNARKSPLCFAAESGSAAVVRLLLAAGADFNTLNEHFMSPLEEAAMRGHAEVLKAMIEFTVDVNARGDNGNTALHFAKDKAVVDVLVEAGANVDARDEREETPLFYAAAGEDIDVVRALANHGADISAKGFDGSTALHAAKGVAVVDMLVEAGADIEARTVEGSTPLIAAASAANQGSFEALRALVGHGADLNAKDARGSTALHWAAASVGDAPSAVDVVDFLLRSGADESLTDGKGILPADVVGQSRWDDFGEDKVEHVRQLLAKAPADRRWRRRRPLLLSIARHLRDELLSAASNTTISGIDTQGTADSSVAEERPEGGWTVVPSWLAGLRPGQEGIFRKIVGYV